MIGILVQHFIALALTIAFASLGSLILGEGIRLRDLWSWNRAFIVGLTASAAALFPLSVLLPHTALLVIAGSLGCALVCALILRRVGLPRVVLTSDPFSRALLGIILFYIVAWVWSDGLLTLGWDGFQIWGIKTMALVRHGGLAPELWPPSPNTKLNRVVRYPPMVPLFEALVAVLRGHFEWDGAKAAFSILYLSMLASIYRACRPLVTERLALGGVLLAASLPAHFDVTALGGYADLPLAAVLAASIAAFVDPHARNRTFHSPAAWSLAGLLTVKDEGPILFGIAIFTVAIWSRKRLAALWKPGLIAATGLALRLVYERWTIHVPTEFTLDLARAWNRASKLPGAFFPYLVEINRWGLLWIAALFATAIVLIEGRAAQRAIAFAFAAALASYAGLYLFTDWRMEFHMQYSLTRLLDQITPAAIFLIVSAFQILLTRTSATSTEPVSRRSSLASA